MEGVIADYENTAHKLMQSWPRPQYIQKMLGRDIGGVAANVLIRLYVAEYACAAVQFMNVRMARRNLYTTTYEVLLNGFNLCYGMATIHKVNTTIPIRVFNQIICDGLYWDVNEPACIFIRNDWLIIEQWSCVKYDTPIIRIIIEPHTDSVRIYKHIHIGDRYNLYMYDPADHLTARKLEFKKLNYQL